MYDKIAALRTMGLTVNSYGDPVESMASDRDIYCRVTGSTFKEKSIAESRGLTADLTLLLPDYEDYNGETAVVYEEKLYKVVDTYFDDKSNELRVVISRWQTH